MPRNVATALVIVTKQAQHANDAADALIDAWRLSNRHIYIHTHTYTSCSPGNQLCSIASPSYSQLTYSSPLTGHIINLTNLLLLPGSWQTAWSRDATHHRDRLALFTPVTLTWHDSLLPFFFRLYKICKKV